MIIRKTWLLMLLFWMVNGYKLNVPRLLLPYHPTIPMRFELEVGEPSGGCFKWRSTRQDIVKVTPIGNHECSDRAEVVAIAKMGGTHSAVIFADDSHGGGTLNCVVTIDEIVKIVIEHTTKVLYVDAAPAPIAVVAYNANGDKFSTLGKLPFEWELSSAVKGGGSNPLRIMPFEQSKYSAPNDIQELEKKRKKGYIVLLEAINTGSSVINTRLHDKEYLHVSGSSLDLVVVANLLLEPAYDVIVPVDSIIHFGVKMIKGNGIDDVKMPSSLYTLKLENNNICKLDRKSSTVTTLQKGTTNIWLHTENVDATITKNAAVRPPSTKIHIIDPESLQFTITGNNWVVENGRTYSIAVNLLDPHGNQMFIPNNVRFDTVLPVDYLEIMHGSKNGTYFDVRATKTGKITLNSKLSSFWLEGGVEKLVTRKVVGEQQMEIVDPIMVVPAQVIFPYVSHKHFTYPLKAVGGSGSFAWSTENKNVYTVDSSGTIRSGELGWTTITAVDSRNLEIYGTSKVAVLEMVAIDFGKTRKEAEEGQILTLNVQIYGLDYDGHRRQIPFTDCRHVPFAVHVQDHEYFYHEKDIPSQIPTIGTGCGTISLRAMKSGDSRITVSYDRYSSTVEVSAYPPLKIAMDEILMPVESTVKLNIEGGPRPWIHDASQYFVLGKTNNSRSLSSDWDGKLILNCIGQPMTTTLDVVVGNGPTILNEIPARATSRIRVCCVIPSRLSLKMVDEESLTRSFHPKCPFANTMMLASKDFRVGFAAFGRCDQKEEERGLVGIDAIELFWTITEGHNLLDIGKSTTFSNENDQITGGWVDATPKGKSGIAKISAKAVRSGLQKLPSTLAGNLEVKLVTDAVASPASLVLWNDVTTKATLGIEGGSGHFHLLDKSQYYEAQLSGKNVTIIPKRNGRAPIRIADLCLHDRTLEIPVKISDVSSLRIRAPSRIGTFSDLTVYVDIVDDEGDPFSEEFVSAITNRHFQIQANKGKLLQPGPGDKCEITVMAGQTGVVELTPHGQASASIRQKDVEPIYEAKSSCASSNCTISWLLTPLLTICIGALIFLGAWIFFRSNSVSWGTANNNLSAGVFASERSGLSDSVLNAGDSYVWRESPPRYHSTPLDNSASSGPVGSGGSPQLWSSTNMRRRL